VDRYAGDFDARAEDASVAENVKENTPRAGEGGWGGRGIPGSRRVRISVRLFMLFMAQVTLAIVRAKSFRIVRIRCANRPCDAAQPVPRLRNIRNYKLRKTRDGHRTSGRSSLNP